MTSDPSVDEMRVLIYAPIGRDAALTADLLSRASIPCHVCASVRELREHMQHGAGAVLLTEEALGDAAIEDLAAALEVQPGWSDISVLLFAGGEHATVSPRTLRTLEVLRNVTLLDRPVRVSAVISTVQAALRGRRRQYELRDVLLALDRARNDAEQANRLKDEFLATLSHELRTPLNAILGWVAMLRQDQVEPAKRPRILEIIERNANAQAQLIADVLDVSRMITGRMRLQTVPVLLSRVLNDAVDSMRPAADAKGVRLEFTADDNDNIILRADPERLQQVFWNLLSNAVKFTPAGGRVMIGVTRTAAGVEVLVTDTGAGLSPEFLPFAFDRFRQADQSFTRAQGGLGLGLAIVKHLIELHGGQVTVFSAGSGRGATFSVHLPTTEPLANLLRSSGDDTATPGDAPRGAFVERVVLVVEDDATTRELLTTMLSAVDARVVAVDSARAAVAQLEVEVPAVILADIGMPEEDGLSMIRRIRSRDADHGGAVRAIALSAYARAEDRQAALSAGFDDFLTKPAMPADIIRTLEHWLTAPRA